MSTDEQRGKRRADVQLTKDAAGESSGDEHATGGDGITRASGEVLAARKRVSVKRSVAPPAAPKASNPFAGISLTAPSAPSAQPTAPAPSTAVTLTAETTAPTSTATEKLVDTEGRTTTAPAATPTTAFSEEPKPTDTTSGGITNPATTSGGFGLANSGGGFGGFGGFGGLAKANGGVKSGFGGLAFGSSTPLAFGKETKPSAGADQATATEKDTTPSVFGAQPSSKKEEPVEAQQTGEEEEETVQSCAASLFEFVEDKENGKREWRTRGTGEFKLNKDKETGQRGRLIMRQRGIGKLLLNANVYKNMTVSVMADGNGISFSCVNCVGADDEQGHNGDQRRLSMFAVKLGKDAKDQVGTLVDAIKEFV